MECTSLRATTCSSCCAPSHLPRPLWKRYTGISRKVLLTRLNCYLLTLAVLPAFAAPPKPAVENAVSDRFRPIALDQQKLGGILAERIRASREGYLEHVNDGELLVGFASRGSDGSQAQDEQIGRFLNAAANSFDYSRDPNLKAVMDRMAAKLLAAASTKDDRATRRVSSYDLLGLLAYYRITGNINAIVAAKQIGDELLKDFSSNSSPIGVLEPFVYLFRFTADARYLNFSKSLAATLASNASRSDATYRSLSDLVGMMELYRLTGDELYFRSVMAAWKTINSSEVTVTGAPIPAEAESNGQHPQPDICSTVAWLQLNLELLRITGDTVYADQLERTIYNQLFAGEDYHTGNVFAQAPLEGTKETAVPSDRCNTAEAEGISLIPAVAWGRYGPGIAVTLYTAGRVNFQLRRRGAVQLYSEASFPETGDVLLHVEPAHNLQFPLRLRVPNWTNNFVAEIGGNRLSGRPGEFLTINREWKRGDTVKITMAMTVHVIDGAPGFPDHFALQRGPQLLALGKTLNPGMNDFAAALPASSDPSQLKTPPAESRLPANLAGGQAYTFPGEYEGRHVELVLVPFADATTYRVWLRKPAASSGASL